MMKIREIFITNRLQYVVFICLSFFAALSTLVLYFIDISPFQRFLGNINPLLGILISFLLGLVLLSYLINKRVFRIYKKHHLKNYLIISGFAMIFGIEVIIADVWLVNYPVDINILFPKSLLFYPAIGYIVEVVFHLLPISTIIIALSVFKKLRLNTIVWISIIAVALLEPLYQVWFTSQNSLVTSIYTGIHVCLFSLTQLFIFRRYDFMSMYLFRIVFYLVWHILWGEIRVELLFT